MKGVYEVVKMSAEVNMPHEHQDNPGAPEQSDIINSFVFAHEFTLL